MKKKKGTEIKFDPADYAYMDKPDMTTEGWLWEFERRSDIYKRTYSFYWKRWEDYKIVLAEISKRLRTKKISMTESENRKKKAEEQYRDQWNKYVKENPRVNELLFFESCFFDPSKRWSEVDHVKATLSRANPVKIMNLKWGNKLPLSGKVYHVKIKGKDFCVDMTEEPEPLPKVGFKVEGAKGILTYKLEPLHPLDLLHEQLGKEEIIMAIINIKANDSVIRSLLESDLDYWRKKLNISRTREAKKPKKKSTLLNRNASLWKDYLIVYDLYAECGDCKAVANILLVYDNDKVVYSEKNIENYQKKAEELIDGKYKTLL